jgi:hypothetical protein
MRLLILSFLGACATTEKVEESPQEISLDEDGDGFIADEDCDDSNPLVYPGTEEICDGIDNNCNTEIDEEVLITFYSDGDEDGFGNSNITMEACSQNNGFVSIGTDCNDGDPNVFPGADEICDDKDNDCNDEIDEGLALLFYIDQDGDGFGDEEQAVEACSPAFGLSTIANDCNDQDINISPLAVEVCDGLDNNCDGETDEDVTTIYYRDFDEDGFGDENNTEEACVQPEGYIVNADDCDDIESYVNPSAVEVCDTMDNDCDDDIDEAGSIGEATFYADIDNDGFGDPNTTLVSCTLPVGYATTNTDCDDGAIDTYPDAPELCNNIDDNCDDDIDEDEAIDAQHWNIDYDSDGFGSDSYVLVQCAQPTGYVLDDTDCNDSMSSIYPNAVEYCNEMDDDCDGNIDELDAVDLSTFYEDIDNDGYGINSSTTESCSAPTNYSAVSGDCDDGNDAVSPNALELCNNIDDDCDGNIDESDSTDVAIFYSDADEDGFGDPSQSIESCSQPIGFVDNDQDCNDSDSSTNPNIIELCNDVDDDCNGIIDDEILLPHVTYYLDNDGDGYGDPTASIIDCMEPTGYVTNDEDCNDLNSTLSPINGCALDCYELMEHGVSTSGSYLIDPDGIGIGDTPFEVYCDMDTDGGGWIKLALSSAGSDFVYRTIPDSSNTGIVRGGDQARYFNHITADGFTGSEFNHNASSIYPNYDEQDITYENPASGLDFTADELTSIRSIVTELSQETRMVAGAVDDSCNYSSILQPTDGLGHEIYISNGSGSDFINLTYGTQPNDEEDGYYLYHTDPSLSTTDNVTLICGGTETTHLESEYLIPAKIQIGWFADINGQWGGAAYWGWEWDYFLVR